MLTLVAAAMMLALARASGQRDVVVQNCVSGRTDLRLSGTIGAFFDIVALRLVLPETGTLGDVLKQARNVVMAGYAHQVFSWHQTKTLLAAMNASDVAPILNFFNYFDGTPKTSMKLKSYALQPSPPFRRSAKEYPNISFRIVHNARGISGTVEYLDVCYARRTITAFCRDFVEFLGNLVGQPERKAL